MNEQIEKQAIEELTNELVFTNNYGTCDAVAKYLYEKGYRKQSEGEWENVYDHDTPDGHLQRKTACSVCGYKPKGDISAKTPYCPNCGAHMKGD